MDFITYQDLPFPSPDFEQGPHFSISTGVIDCITTTWHSSYISSPPPPPPPSIAAWHQIQPTPTKRPPNMPSRLSKLFRPSDKEKEALASSDLKRQPTDLSTTSSSSPPPTYNEALPDYDEDHQLEDPPSMTAGFSNLKLSDAATSDMALPEVDETIAHLKVLEAFSRLRQRVGSCDGTFGIRDEWVRGSASQVSRLCD